MSWKQSAFSIVLCCGLCTLSLGCAAVTALVSSPAGFSAPGNGAGRLAAIGRVFENQGHYEQAQVMYRRALKQSPGNVVAQQRLEYLARRNTDRTFDSAESRTRSAIAMADSLKAPDRSAKPAATERVPKPTQKAQIAAVDVEQEIESERNALLASLQPAAAETPAPRPSKKPTITRTNHGAETPEVSELPLAAVETLVEVSEPSPAAVPVAEPVLLRPETTLQPAPALALADKPAPVPPAVLEQWRPVARPRFESTDDNAGKATVDNQIRVVDTGWSLGNVTNAGAADVAMTFAETPAVRSVSRVSYSGTDSGIDHLPLLNTETAWKSLGRLVTLEELLQWTDAPIANRDNLLLALSSGADEGVKALAAAMLAECPVNDREVDAALEAASENGSDLLRLSARDVLIQRGRITQSGVADLLTLLAGNNTDIRAQAAASLRNCAGSRFSPQCVAGLGALLSDRNPEVVALAANTLGDFGADASEHRDRLIQLLATTDNDLILDAVNTAVNRVPAR